jgi:hypothetical protein
MPFSLVEVYRRFGIIYCLGYGLSYQGKRFRFVVHVHAEITTEEHNLLKYDAVYSGRSSYVSEECTARATGWTTEKVGLDS